MYIYGRKFEHVQAVADHLLIVSAKPEPFFCGACVVTTCALPNAGRFDT